MNIPSVTTLFGGGKSDTTETTTADSTTKTSPAYSTDTTATETTAVEEAAARDPKLVAVEKDTNADTATKDKTTLEAVEHDTVKKHHTEEVQQVINKEKHQDHYHTTVQPLVDQEVKPEEHDYKEADTVKRTVDHEDAAATKAKLEAEKAKVGDSSTVLPTQEDKVTKADVEGTETVHHHYHEQVQPVIEKEIVKDSVTHTKVPIHETHQEASVVHETTTAAPISVNEFKNADGSLAGDKA